LKEHFMPMLRFRYTTALKDAFLGGGISSLQSFDDRGWVAGNQANVFVTNHDTERVRFVDTSEPACSIMDLDRMAMR
jgi:hypothetical protein